MSDILDLARVAADLKGENYVPYDQLISRTYAPPPPAPSRVPAPVPVAADRAAPVARLSGAQLRQAHGSDDDDEAEEGEASSEGSSADGDEADEAASDMLST
jgi:hypothetical protein